MKVIGITGGVGAGKSAILDYVDANFRAKILKADEIAHKLMAPGSRCYEALEEVLPPKLFLQDGTLDKTALSAQLFRDEELRRQVNEIVHPAVKVHILDTIAKERKAGTVDYLMVEAALLIEAGYQELCDELWYVHASEDHRKKRLMESRGYTEKKAEEIFSSQLSEGIYRRYCKVVIENDGALEYAFYQVTQALSERAELEVDIEQVEGRLVFGLDIGTRNIVGTVGYKEEDEFYVIAQHVKEHETRSMLDGQIHDIGRVGRSIHVVKRHLEEQIGVALHEVCIAAAGRVLKTVTTTVEYEFEEDTVVEREHIHTLELLGVEKAQQILNEHNDTKFRFYSVGYSVMKYYVNEEVYSNLESHKAKRISADIIVTFLPEEVVDDLYSAVEIAGLRVASLTLEPIAAINVAIPEAFRMLNIALVDVGAGTSDISVTRDGSIIAYGMIPSAGDEITELLVQHYLVDFKTAEHIKVSSGVDDEITYMDIMSISHTIPAKEVWELVAPLVERLVKDIANKIKELNGGETVSATFVVGGGGKVHNFVKLLADELELPQERVALRGEEVLKEVHFKQQDIKKDPLLVTPIGICLNFYEQRNNFIFARFNGERIKLYDNGKLTIVDAAMEAGFPNEQLFPRRGREINYTLDGKSRIVRGEAGESAIVKVNGSVVNINTPLEQNSEITIEPSTAGTDASSRLDELEEYRVATLSFEVNGKLVNCPKFFEVNGHLQPPFYQIQEGDAIETRSYYTVGQVMEFMDVEIDTDQDILVNNRFADLDTLVYENFSIEWKVLSFRSPETEEEKKKRLSKKISAKPAQQQPAFEWPFGLGREIAKRKKEAAQEKEKLAVKEKERPAEAAKKQPAVAAKEAFGQSVKEAMTAASGQPLQNQPAEAATGAAKSQPLPNQLPEEVNQSEPGQPLPDQQPSKAATAVASGQPLQNQPAEAATETAKNQPLPNQLPEEVNQSEQGQLLQVQASGEVNQSEASQSLPNQASGEVKAAEASQSLPNQALGDVAGQPSATAAEPSGQPSDEVMEVKQEQSEASQASAEVKAAEVSQPVQNHPSAEGGVQAAERTAEQTVDAVRKQLAELTGAAAEPSVKEQEETPVQPAAETPTVNSDGTISITVTANQQPVTMSGKESYVLVDIFEYISFDLNAGNGRRIIVKLNGESPSYMQEISDGDVIEVYWQER